MSVPSQNCGSLRELKLASFAATNSTTTGQSPRSTISKLGFGLLGRARSYTMYSEGLKEGTLSVRLGLYCFVVCWETAAREGLSISAKFHHNRTRIPFKRSSVSRAASDCEL